MGSKIKKELKSAHFRFQFHSVTCKLTQKSSKSLNKEQHKYSFTILNNPYWVKRYSSKTQNYVSTKSKLRRITHFGHFNFTHKILISLTPIE